MSHTKEPLTFMELPTADGEFMVLGGDDHGDFGLVASCVKLEDARRIVACVNACAGIDTEFLAIAPHGLFKIILDNEEFTKIKKQRDELLAALERKTVVLTGKEIRELAEFAGFRIVEDGYADEYESEIAVESCPAKGIINDDNKPEHYRLIAFFNEYPEEGCLGLGEQIEAPAIASVKGGA